VEERIAAAGPHQAVVLAMHQPPFDLQGQPKPGYAAFLTWLEKSKVDYLLCGHVHGYIRKQVGNTTVIINGVGGDYDKWQLDQKVFATILEIDGSKISDRAIQLEPVHEIWENIEHFAIGHVAEGYRGHPLLCWGGTLLLVGGVGWAFRRIFANREPFAGAPG
jgi:3',5'-cyclic AMP phosphodiesterase CpdA